MTRKLTAWEEFIMLILWAIILLPIVTGLILFLKWMMGQVQIL